MNLSPGDTNFHLIVANETLASPCGFFSKATCFANAKDNFVPCRGEVEVGRFSEDNGNLFVDLSWFRTGVLMQLTIDSWVLAI